MGYTQYWNVVSTATPKAWEDLLNIATVIIPLSYAIIRDGSGEGEPVLNKDEIMLNGSADEDCDFETFEIRFNSGSNNFCKTGMRPYDEVVVALLIAGVDVGVLSSWSSDGGIEEHKAGKELLKRGLMQLENPV